MSFTKAYNISSDSLKGDLIVGIGANSPTRIDLANRRISYSEGRGDYVQTDASTEETLSNRLDSIKSKFINEFVGNSFRVVDLEPGEDLIKRWSETQEGAAYWTAQWKAVITGLKFNLSDSLGDKAEGNHVIYLTPIQTKISDALEAAKLDSAGEASRLSEMSKLVFSFYSTSFPTRGESPVAAMTASKDDITVDWKLRDGSSYSLRMVKGVIYPIEPYTLTKISEGGVITLLS